MKRVVVRGGQKILGTLASGIGDPILTKDSTTNELGSISPIDPSTYLTTTLSNGSIIIGNSSNVATPRSLTGAVLITNLGLTSISPDVITNSNIFSGAGIQYSKLNLTNSIVNNDIATLANINRSKLATGTPYRMVVNDSTGRLIDANSITAGRVLISDLNGLPTDSGLTSTTLSYIDVSSSIQTQLNNRLFFSNSITPVEGDLIVFQSGTWNRFAKGSSGQYLSSTVGGLQWVTTPNGLPVGGSTNDYLRKNSSTDYDTVWDVLNVAKIVDITATAAQINVLATGYYDVTSSIQTQLSNKLNNTLSNNAIFVGNNVNQPGQLAAGSNGQVLTVVAGVPQWQTISGTGTVTSVAFSGGSTGLSVTGSPITTSGTITLTGTINPTHGGTGLVTYTTGDLLYASASNVLSSLAVGTSGYVLTVSGGIPTWQANAGASVLTTKGDLFTYDTGNQRLPIGTDGYILTADSGQATGMKWALPISEPFTDNIAIIKNNADNTKLVKFDASIISTATTRTYTLPDFSGTVALLGSTNGAALSKVDDTNITITLSGNPNTALLAATTITLGWTGTLADGKIASSSNWNTAYDRSGTSLGFTSSTFTFTKQDASTLTIAVPTFNQNTTGSAAKWTTARNLAGNSVDGSANVAFANTFIVQGTTDSGLSGAQFLGALATGIVKNTTTTGVLSIAVAGDFPTLNQNTTGSAGSVINALTVDNSSIQLSSGTTYDGSAAKTISVKALGITNSLIANSTIDLTTKVTGVLPVANGGTNISSYTIGDIIYASGATTLSKLADVAAGSYLRSGGVTTVPVWSTVTLPNSATTGDLIYASGTNTYSNLAVGGATTVLHGGATPSYSAVSLTADVSGILPIANGGSGSSSVTQWLLASGGTLSGANTITGSSSNTLTLNFSNLNTTITDGAGILLTNTTQAAAGAQQISPILSFSGQGWKTTATASSQAVEWQHYVLPIQGTTAPTSQYILKNNVNGVAQVGGITLLSNGASMTTFAQGLQVLASGGAGIHLSGGTPISNTISTASGFTLSNPGNVSSAATIFTLAPGAATNTSGLVIAINSTFTFQPSSGTGTLNYFAVNPTINQTGGANGDIKIIDVPATYTSAGGNVTGIDYHPTVTSVIGTHLAWRNTSGSVLINGSTITASTIVDIRGAGTTTANTLRLADSGNSAIFTIQDNGVFTNTISSSGSTVTSTWTATANNQFMGRFTGTATTENVNSDVIIGYQFDPNFTRNASNPTTQSAYSVYIKQPTISNGAFATAASLLLQGGGTNALPALVLGNSAFTSPLNVYQSANSTIKFDIGSTAVFSISNLGIGFGSLSPTSGFNIIGSSVIAVNSGTASGTTDVAFNLRRTGFGGNSGVGSYLPITFTNRYTTGLWSDASIRHVVYDNGSATATDGYEFYNHQSQDASTAVQLAMIIKGNLAGIGSNTSPTARLELSGAISSASWTTTGIQMAFDAATYTDTGTAGTRATGVAIGVARPTYASTNAVTVTDAATVYIANDVAAGTNMTLTRTHALWVAAGLARFDGGIKGTTTNDAATAGNYGEEVNSTVSTYTNYTTTITYQNITSITLTAGDWDISAFATFSSNGATITGASNAIFVISTTSASATGSTEGVNISYVPQAALLGTSLESITIAPYRVSLSGTTTYYLNTQAAFTLGNPQFVGSIRARRHR